MEIKHLKIKKSWLIIATIFIAIIAIVCSNLSFFENLRSISAPSQKIREPYLKHKLKNNLFDNKLNMLADNIGFRNGKNSSILPNEALDNSIKTYTVNNNAILLDLDKRQYGAFSYNPGQDHQLFSGYDKDLLSNHAVYQPYLYLTDKRKSELQKLQQNQVSAIKASYFDKSNAFSGHHLHFYYPLASNLLIRDDSISYVNGDKLPVIVGYNYNYDDANYGYYLSEIKQHIDQILYKEHQLHSRTDYYNNIDRLDYQIYEAYQEKSKVLSLANPWKQKYPDIDCGDMYTLRGKLSTKQISSYYISKNGKRYYLPVVVYARDRKIMVKAPELQNDYSYSKAKYAYKTGYFATKKLGYKLAKAKYCSKKFRKFKYDKYLLPVYNQQGKKKYLDINLISMLGGYYVKSIDK